MNDTTDQREVPIEELLPPIPEDVTTFTPEERIKFIQTCRELVRGGYQVPAKHLNVSIELLRIDRRQAAASRKSGGSKTPVVPVTLDDL